MQRLVMRRLLTVGMGIVSLWVFATAGHPDEFRLANGNTLRGELASADEDGLVVKLDVGGFSKREPWVNFSSGYIQRALAQQPKQGSRRPWKLYQNYALDLLSLRFGRLRDDAMVFSNRAG